DKGSLQKELRAMLYQLNNAKKEISQLSGTKTALSKEIETTRSGFVLFKVNEVITTSVIDPETDAAKIETKLKEVLAATDSIIKKAINGRKKQYIIMKDKELEEAVAYTVKIPGKVIVRVVSANNVLYNEEVPVHFELFENVLVFKKADKLGSTRINGGKSLSEIEQAIKVMLAQVSDAATAKGILPDASGSVGNIAYSRIFEVAKEIKSQKKTTDVEIYTEKDTFTMGPLEVNLRLVK
ncbi:MAG: hypothetical protein AABZ57_03620, partial [Candidatus Margulisiibacteriota bacterium]